MKPRLLGWKRPGGQESPFDPCTKPNGNTYAGEVITTTAAFHTRDGAKLHHFAGKWWILGGWEQFQVEEWGNQVTTNEVWSSTDLETWTLELAHDDDPPTSGTGARWRRRHNYGSCVKDGLLWVVGGDHLDSSFPAPPSDVWNSPDGVTWTRVSASSPWGPKRLPIVGVHQNRIHVCGGETVGDDFPASDEHWSSADGLAWTFHPRMPVKRCAVTQLVEMCGKMFLCGGNSLGLVERQFENDVWAWDPTVGWVLQCESAPWPGRMWNGVAAYDNKLWICAGRVELEEDIADLWCSETLGRTWVQVEAPWVATHADGVAATEEDGLVMASGFGSDKTVCRVRKV